jgi:hypothetical protein
MGFEAEVKKIINVAMGDKNLMYALDSASEVSASYETKFEANWMMARAFNNLGMNINAFEAIVRGKLAVTKDPGELGCKLAYVNLGGVKTILIMGDQGAIIMNIHGEIFIHGGYEEHRIDQGMAMGGVTLRQTLRELMEAGLPYMGLIPILDKFVTERKTVAEMSKAHTHFRHWMV